MARYMNHEGPLYRVAILNRMSGHTTYYGPYELLSTAKGIRTYEIDSYWNKRRAVPNIGWIEETDPTWTKVENANK